MKHRFTIEELQHKDSPNYMDDIRMLRMLVNERLNSVSNAYAPLAERLRKLSGKLERLVQSEVRELTFELEPRTLYRIKYDRSGVSVVLEVMQMSDGSRTIINEKEYAQTGLLRKLLKFVSEAPAYMFEYVEPGER